MLSEQAYERIYNAGESFFKTEEHKQRWALFLKQEMDGQGKKEADLKPFVEASPKIVQEWVQGTVPVPADAQKIICAWLARPARELFSDQAPSFMEETGSPPETPAHPERPASTQTPVF